MIEMPEELLEQLARGNVLLFIGEETTRHGDRQVLKDLIAPELAERTNIPKTEGLSFPEIAQIY